MAKRRRSTQHAAAVRRAAAPARSVKRYGWLPDLPDQRDFMFKAPLRRIGKLPPVVDLRRLCPPIYDQGQLGSCTANAIGAALEFDQMKQRLTDVFPPSRLFIYYNERVIENTVAQDSGAMIRDGIKSVSKQGAPHEALWPYNIGQFKTKPSAASYTDAAKHPAVLYQRVDRDLTQMQGCLADGFPFVFGFSVYESFEGDTVAKSGHAPMPKKNEKQLGGHAVMCVGYDLSKKWFIVRNSWGTGWGMAGYFTLPFGYFTAPNLSDDFWTVSLVK
jgi:C1A family cysteine protease